MIKKATLESLLAEKSLQSDLFMYKDAQTQADDTQFESDFSNLAFMFIQDRAPALMPYILGFETVDRDEDGTKAVGIFGFKIGKNYYYVPAFFLNNQVKGVESILSKSTNSFIPLTEEWINFIINRDAMTLGEEAPATDSQEEDFENPNFDFLRRPKVGPLGGPAYYKTASDKSHPVWNGGLEYFAPEIDADGDEKPWSLKKAWDVMQYRVIEGLKKDAEFQKAVHGFDSAMKGVPFSKEASAPVSDFIKYVGGPNAAKTLLSAMKGNVKFANAALSLYDNVGSFLPKSFAKDCYIVKKAQEAALEMEPPVTFTTKSDGQEASAKDILEDGFTVVDKRDDDHTSYTVEADYENEFQNPDRSGKYDVLVVGGATKPAYVLNIDRSVASGPRSGMIVYFPDNNQVIVTAAHNILTHKGCKEGFKSIYDNAKYPSKISENGGDYVFMGPDGSCTGVFHVDRVQKDTDSRPVLKGYMSSHYDYKYDESPSVYDDTWQGLHSGPSYMSFDDIELADFDGRPKVANGVIVMPRNWKVLDVSRKESGVREELSSNYDTPAPEPHYILGSLYSLNDELRKEGAAKLDVRSDDGTDFYMSYDGNHFTQTMPYKQAAVLMVTRLGMRYPDAKSMLKKAAVERKAVKLLKMGQFVGVDPRMPPEQSPASDPYTGIPQYQTPYESEALSPFTGVEPPPPDNYYGENLDGEATRNTQGGEEEEFDPEAQQLAQDAAAMGQKTVFDQAAIGGLAKVYDVGAVVDSYLPEFMHAIDRLGRVMFLYYWKHDDFVERYGTDEVVEMEDVLRSTFKQLGKLTLDLRKKAVGQGDADAAV